MTTEPDSGYPRLEDQIAWYDRKSGHNQRRYKQLRVTQLVITALIPILAAIPEPVFVNLGIAATLITAILAGIVLVIEGIQALNQYHQNWITYRATCEALRHEKYTYLGRVGSYEGTDEQAMRTLVRRVESQVSTEHAKWVGRTEGERKHDNKPS